MSFTDLAHVTDTQRAQLITLLQVAQEALLEGAKDIDSRITKTNAAAVCRRYASIAADFIERI